MVVWLDRKLSAVGIKLFEMLFTNVIFRMFSSTGFMNQAREPRAIKGLG